MTDKIELVFKDGNVEIKRFPVAGGWLYITRNISSAIINSPLSTTFVPYHLST